MSSTPADPYVAPAGASDSGAPESARSTPDPGWPHPVYVDATEEDLGAAVEAGEARTLGARLRARLGDTGDDPGGAVREIVRLSSSPDLLESATDALAEDAERRETDVIVGLQPGGFMLGPLVARKLRAPFVPAWRDPRVASASGWVTVTYASGETGDERELSLPDELERGARCYLVDGRLASDATLEASFRLVREGGGVVVGVGVIADGRTGAGGYMVDDHNLLALNDLD